MKHAETAFALAAVLHAGFQVTVTVLVYPALARTGREHRDEWSVVHDRHSRAIVPLVAIAYVGLLAAGVWLLADGPDVFDLLALGGAWGAVLVTGAVAAPTHGRLTTPDAVLLHRLLVADRWRAGLALLGAGFALVALVTG